MNLDTMVKNGYKWGAPTTEVENIDAAIVAKMRCPKCGSKMHYDGYHKNNSYIALAVCNLCKHQIEF